MPAGAAEPLIGVFENIAAGKQRAREKQAELSQQELERIAHEHYYDALAKHEANLDEEAKAKLELEKRKQTFLESEDSPAARRERSSYETQQRLTEKQTSEIQRKMEADAAKRWKDSMQEHLQGGNPGLIAGGLPQSEQQKFIDSIKAIQKHEYDTKKAASDAQLAEQIGQLRRSVPDPASAGIFGAVTGGMPDEVEKALIPQIGDLTMQAAKKLGPPPGEDDWMDYSHPAYREKVRKDDALIKYNQERVQALKSREARDAMYVKHGDELASATVALKKAQAKAASERTAILDRSEKYRETFGNAHIAHAKVMEGIERLKARATINSKELGPYLQLQREAASIGRLELGHNLTEQTHLKNQKLAAEHWLGSHGKYADVKEEVEEVGGGLFREGRKVPVPKWTKGEKAGQPLSDTPDPTTKTSELDDYKRYQAIQKDLNDKDDPDTLAGRLKQLSNDIKDNQQNADIGAVPFKSGNLPTINLGGGKLAPLKPEQIRALDKSEKANTAKKAVRKALTAEDFLKKIGR